MYTIQMYMHKFAHDTDGLELHMIFGGFIIVHYIDTTFAVVVFNKCFQIYYTKRTWDRSFHSEQQISVCIQELPYDFHNVSAT